MEGHASTIGGCVVDSGNFDWYQNDKFPGLTTPDESYHGVTYAKDFGKNGYIVKIVAQLLRDYGSTPSPFNSFLLNIGLESLAVRVERHCENAQKVAEYLEKNDKIAWVNYPGLKSSKDYELAKKYLPHGICGVISFGVKGGREKAEQFMNSSKLAAIVTHSLPRITLVLSRLIFKTMLLTEGISVSFLISSFLCGKSSPFITAHTITSPVASARRRYICLKSPVCFSES